jgi:hypothetical protein
VCERVLASAATVASRVSAFKADISVSVKRRTVSAASPCAAPHSIQKQ